MLAYLVDICWRIASKSSDPLDGSEGGAEAFPFPFPFDCAALGVPAPSDGVAVTGAAEGFFLRLD